MIILAVDPGADAGWALFVDGELAMCGLGIGDASTAGDLRGAVDRIVVEKQHQGRTRARRKDITTLTLRAGETAGLLRHVFGVEVEYVEPARWKGGSIDKATMHKRIMRALKPGELARLAVAEKAVAKGKRHNMLDAIGIGLSASRRIA